VSQEKAPVSNHRGFFHALRIPVTPSCLVFCFGKHTKVECPLRGIFPARRASKRFMSDHGQIPQKLGRYDIVRILGRGAMGVVYEARDPNLGRKVAIKIIRLETLTEQEAAEYELRFRTEAHSAARLQHPNIVSVYDADRDGGMPFLVMELIIGEDLKQYLDAGQRYSLEQSVRMMTDLLSALDYAHQQKIIHRDVKPANMMILANGQLKLTDFGVARIQDSGEATRTQGGVVGTLKYMSPEQVEGKTVGASADLFSAGIVLYQLLTDRRPFDGDSYFSIATQITKQHPPPPSSINPALPFQLDAVVARALAKDKLNRFSNAQEFSAALQAAARKADPTIVPSANPYKVIEPLGTGPLERSGSTNSLTASGNSVTQELELVYWKDVKDSDDALDLEGFLRRFPDGVYGDLARRRLKRIAGIFERSIPQSFDATQLVPKTAAGSQATSSGVTSATITEVPTMTIPPKPEAPFAPMPPESKPAPQSAGWENQRISFPPMGSESEKTIVTPTHKLTSFGPADATGAGATPADMATVIMAPASAMAQDKNAPLPFFQTTDLTAQPSAGDPFTAPSSAPSSGYSTAPDSQGWPATGQPEFDPAATVITPLNPADLSYAHTSPETAYDNGPDTEPQAKLASTYNPLAAVAVKSKAAPKPMVKGASKGASKAGSESAQKMPSTGGSKMGLILGAVAVVAAIGIGAVMMMSSKPPPRVQITLDNPAAPVASASAAIESVAIAAAASTPTASTVASVVVDAAAPAANNPPPAAAVADMPVTAPSTRVPQASASAAGANAAKPTPPKPAASAPRTQAARDAATRASAMTGSATTGAEAGTVSLPKPDVKAPPPKAPEPLAAPVRPVDVGPKDPKDACAGKILFAYGACLYEKCATSEFSKHPSCAEIRDREEQRRRLEQNR
jgi:eukaryotic-like serine/threonine-protein kinase